MKISIILVSILFVVSCQDLKKKEQLSQVQNLNKTVDSIRNVYSSNKIDTLSRIIYAVTNVEFKIKHTFTSDTINHDFGRKMNEYNMMKKKLKSVGKMYNQIEKGTTEESLSLKRLTNDINSDAGEKSKYDEYIVFETEKVKQLRLVLKDMTESQINCLDTYNRLHEEIKDVSLSFKKS